MNVQDDIDAYISSQPEPKRFELQTLHERILHALPGCRFWYLDGKDESGKVVSNPNIGYGQYTITYANGSTRDFYQIGLSANTSGISVYILGLEDKNYLRENFGPRLGKAAVTGYCIKFKKLSDIDLDILMSAITNGAQLTSAKS